jgi:hypothetical protein
MYLSNVKYLNFKNFISISKSSSISWGEKSNKKSKLFKAFTPDRIEILEECYQRYMDEKAIEQAKPLKQSSHYKSIIIDQNEEVNFIVNLFIKFFLFNKPAEHLNFRWILTKWY